MTAVAAVARVKMLRMLASILKVVWVVERFGDVCEVVRERVSCINEDGSSDDDDIFRTRLLDSGTRTLYT